MKRIMFYMGHPAHFHMFNHTISLLRANNYEIAVMARPKDVLLNLLEENKMSFEMIRQPEKGSRYARMLSRTRQAFQIVTKFRPALLMGPGAEIAYSGRLLNIPVFSFTEDDVSQISPYARTVFPFVTKIVSPYSCDLGKWSYKKIAYNGYQKLAYLHPDVFQPDATLPRLLSKENKPYFILRFASLNAYHDEGIKGIDRQLAGTIINILSQRGNVYISSERKLEEEFERYRIPFKASDMHSAMAGARLVVSDSQSMTVESAMMGIPSVRFNDFAGKIGILNELENTYGLTYGFNTSQSRLFVERLMQLLNNPDIGDLWQERKKLMLNDKVNSASFYYNLALNYKSFL